MTTPETSLTGEEIYLLHYFRQLMPQHRRAITDMVAAFVMPIVSSAEIAKAVKTTMASRWSAQ